ncbi:MAG: asparagine synthase (glutamine-hydrolyzing) [Rhodospirillaceae bacterium]|nr:asparagine synthase (glutamine-hydrolyzing) [Rhodospirillales bacterium]
MCGISGVFTYAGAAADLQPGVMATLASMRARGPDGEGVWNSPDRTVCLGHRRLSIIDLSNGGSQPMDSADGRVTLVFNGEIYNYRSLRRELEADGAVFRSDSDTEVLLALYQRHGRDMLGRLRGMFAFALWDGERQGMLLARDGFGIKPLYLADDGKTLRVASQVKALLAGGGIDTSPEPAGHAGFYLWGHVPEPFTLYRGIRALAPGQWLWQERGRAAQSGRFFDLSAELASIPADGSIDLAQALRDSVAHHMIADVPVGVFLSAGLDSSLLTALASQVSAPVDTLTLGFSDFAGTANDEVPLAELTAAHYHTRHSTIRVPKEDFAAARADILAAMDQPSIDGVNVWLVSRAAAQRGLKVALSGLGGDELFAGYGSFGQLPRLAGALAPLAAVPMLGKGFRLATQGWLSRFTSPKWAGLLEYGSSLGGAYLLRRGLFMPWELPQVLDPHMAREGWARLHTETQLAQAVAGLGNGRLAVSALEGGFYMRNQLLRDADWAGMAHSLEIRVPLVDVELWRSVVSLVKAGKAPSKRDMAHAAMPALPDAVLNRPKTGFHVPIDRWMGHSSLRGWARSVHKEFCRGAA